MSRHSLFLDPWDAAEQGRRLEGSFELRELSRVAEMLTSPEGTARFSLAFFRDAMRRPCVRGWVQSQLSLECQRCLEPVTVAVEAEVLLGLVRGYDEAARLPEGYDPLLVQDERVSVAELVEDEIVLALPQVPMHGVDHACGRSDSDRAPAGPGGETQGPNPDSPFRVLAELKKTLQ
jgi:uncharacterized protein